MMHINIEAVILTAASFFLAISFTSVVSVLASLLAIAFWYKEHKIKRDRYYDRSWIKYIKSFFKK